MDRLKNKKVYAGFLSKEVQAKAIELGYRTSGNNPIEPSEFHRPFLLFFDDGRIGYSKAYDFYNFDNFEEVTPEYILSLEVKKTQWEDFGEVVGYSVTNCANTEGIKAYSVDNISKVLFPTKEEAEACIALSQLLQWRDKYNEGWKPNWTDEERTKYVIEYHNNKIRFNIYTKSQMVLAFKSAKVRDKFFNDFKTLIKQAKPLL